MSILGASYLYLSYNFQKYVLNKKWDMWSSPEVIQTFTLPENIVYHLQRNATNLPVLMKLQKTCKHFASYYKLVELKNLNSSKVKLSSKPEMIVIINNKNKEITEERLISWPVRYALTGELYVNSSSMLLLTSKLLSKTLISNVWKVVLVDQDLTFNEYKFLTVTASQIHLDHCEIVGEDEQLVPAPRLIPWDSDFERFHFFNEDEAYFPHEAFQEMVSKTVRGLSERKVKLLFRPLSLTFDPALFVTFLMNNLNENLTVCLSLRPRDDLLVRNTQEFFDERLKNLPKEKKPNVQIRSF